MNKDDKELVSRIVHDIYKLLDKARADERERCMDAIYKCENLTPAQQYFAIEAIKAE